MKLGGESDPRNKTLMKMFNLIDIGERAGSGVPELFMVWEKEGWEEPRIDERLDSVERTIVTLSFRKRVLKNSAGKKVSEKTKMQYKNILAAMEPGVWYRASEFMDVLGVRESRTKELLSELVALHHLENDGATKEKNIEGFFDFGRRITKCRHRKSP